MFVDGALPLDLCSVEPVGFLDRLLELVRVPFLSFFGLSFVPRGGSSGGEECETEVSRDEDEDDAEASYAEGEEIGGYDMSYSSSSSS